MAPSKKGKKTGTSEPVKKVTQDSRFSHVQEDPRFMRPKKGQSKVKVDKRFAHMIKDKDFTETSKVDRYGRVRDDNRIEAQLRNTYDFSGSEDEESESSNDEDDGDEERPAGYVDRARGEGIDSESSSESDSDISDIEWGKVGGRREGGLSDVEEDPDTIPRGDETRRFACVNLDWDHVRAVDLLTVFSAFKPDGGSVLSVRIYPSEFGKERVAKEAIEGPPRDIFGDSKQNDEDDSGSESDEDLVKRQVED
ncbi:pre-rRNA-processing protein esf1, partial [Linderina macrospora]